MKQTVSNKQYLILWVLSIVHLLWIIESVTVRIDKNNIQRFVQFTLEHLGALFLMLLLCIFLLKLTCTSLHTPTTRAVWNNASNMIFLSGQKLNLKLVFENKLYIIFTYEKDMHYLKKVCYGKPISCQQTNLHIDDVISSHSRRRLSLKITIPSFIHSFFIQDHHVIKLNNKHVKNNLRIGVKKRKNRHNVRR